MNSIDAFKEIAARPEYTGWPLVPGSLAEGEKIPYFGSTLNYKLETPNGTEDYTSIIRSFGWSVAFAVTKDKQVVTLVQWKPGVNQATWELSPGGIGKLDSGATREEIQQKTEDTLLRETGYGNGRWQYLGNVCIESGKFRGASAEDHGLYAHLFLAEDLEQLQDKRNPNPNEIITLLPVPLSAFRAVLESGLFNETSSVACAYKALEKLGILSWNS